MVEPTNNAVQQPHHSILKHDHESHPPRHVMFDEAEIAAYDAQRGHCQTIDDPKTPFHEQESDEDMNAEAENEDEQVDPEVLAHLEEAKQNQHANSICTSGVHRSTRPG